MAAPDASRSGCPVQTCPHRHARKSTTAATLALSPPQPQPRTCNGVPFVLVVAMPEKDSLYSRLRERIVEHAFVGESLRVLWRRGTVDVEVLRSEFDAHGYVLVMARGRIVRHIQFKTGTSSKPSDVSVACALSTKPSGCVIWIRVNEHLDIGPYFWFGGRPGEPLPSIEECEIPRRATHNKKGERPPRLNHRLVPGNRFEQLDSIEDLLAKLFGGPTVDAAEGIRQGLEDVKKGRVRPVEGFFKEFEARNGLSNSKGHGRSAKADS